MSRTDDRYVQKAWQPMNRKSQILTTIVVIAAAVFQIYWWHARLIQSQSSQLQPVQQTSENQNK